MIPFYPPWPSAGGLESKHTGAHRSSATDWPGVRSQLPSGPNLPSVLGPDGQEVQAKPAASHRWPRLRLLRGGLSQPIRGRREVAARKGLVLTGRDEELLVAAYRLGFVTEAQVALALYPPGGMAGRATPSSCAAERLRRLWLWGYVERVELPQPREVGGRQPYLYTLGRRGVSVVQARLGADAPPVHTRRLDRLEPAHIEHDLVAAELWANLRGQVARQPDLFPGPAPLAWRGERDLRALRLGTRDPQTRRWRPFAPDSFFRVRYWGRYVRTAAVEVDNGTLPLRRWRNKVRSFEAFLTDEAAWRPLGVRVQDVVVLVCSEARLEHLLEAAAAEVPEERWEHYLFATFDALQPAAFPTATWVGLAGDECRGLLFRFADDPDPEEDGGDGAEDDEEDPDDA